MCTYFKIQLSKRRKFNSNIQIFTHQIQICRTPLPKTNQTTKSKCPWIHLENQIKHKIELLSSQNKSKGRWRSNMNITNHKENG